LRGERQSRVQEYSMSPEFIKALTVSVSCTYQSHESWTDIIHGIQDEMALGQIPKEFRSARTSGPSASASAVVA